MGTDLDNHLVGLLQLSFLDLILKKKRLSGLLVGELLCLFSSSLCAAGGAVLLALEDSCGSRASVSQLKWQRSGRASRLQVQR